MPKLTVTYSTASNRRSFVKTTMALTGVLISGCAHIAPAKRPKILFVCQAGTAKSAIAREIFKARAKERGIAVDVFSRGLKIEDHLSDALKQELIAEGIDTHAQPALTLAPADWAAADIVVNFNALPAAVVHKDIRDWSDVPSVNDDYSHARAVLDERIDALLSEISRKTKKQLGKN